MNVQAKTVITASKFQVFKKYAAYPTLYLYEDLWLSGVNGRRLSFIKATIEAKDIPVQACKVLRCMSISSFVYFINTIRIR